jgi:Lipopolysaccharide export system permease LptF/LptG
MFLSRRFFVPFLITGIVFLGYLTWDYWLLYADDFAGKGISLSMKWEWVSGAMMGAFFIPAFLMAFLVGNAFYFQHYFKNNKNASKEYLMKNGVAVLVIAVLGFWFTGWVEPACNERSMHLLADIVYAKKGEQIIRSEYSGVKSERMMTFPELIRTRDSVKVELPGPDLSWVTRYPGSRLKKYDLVIMKKIATPFSIIALYLAGLAAGLLLRRAPGITSIVISVVVLIPFWIYMGFFFESLYRHEQTGSFFGAFGTSIIFLLTAGGLIFFRSKGE